MASRAPFGENRVKESTGMNVVLPRGGIAAGLAVFVGLLTAAAGVARADDVVTRSFPSGTGMDSVGITFNAEAEDKEEDAPQALASSPDGMLFLLDQVNGRVLKFDPKR